MVSGIRSSARATIGIADSPAPVFRISRLAILRLLPIDHAPNKLMPQRNGAAQNRPAKVGEVHVRLTCKTDYTISLRYSKGGLAHPDIFMTHRFILSAIVMAALVFPATRSVAAP